MLGKWTWNEPKCFKDHSRGQIEFNFQREFKKYLFTTKLESFSRQQALYIGYNRAEAEAEERQLFESKAQLYNFAAAEGRGTKTSCRRRQTSGG